MTRSVGSFAQDDKECGESFAQDDKECGESFAQDDQECGKASLAVSAMLRRGKQDDKEEERYLTLSCMKYLLLFVVFFAFCANVIAQKKNLVTVKAGNNIMDVIPVAEVFSYPQFTNGFVFLRNGTIAEAKLNHNRLVDEMHFINLQGDTMALDNEKNIRYVVIANDTFYYDKGYVRQLVNRNAVKLAVKRVWVVADTRQVGAYNSTNNSVGMLSFTSINEGGRLYDLIVNEDVILKKLELYYFGNSYNNFVVANKANLLTMFPKEEKRISMYLKENKVNFSRREDVEKIVSFLSEN